MDVVHGSSRLVPLLACRNLSAGLTRETTQQSLMAQSSFRNYSYGLENATGPIAQKNRPEYLKGIMNAMKRHREIIFYNIAFSPASFTWVELLHRNPQIPANWQLNLSQTSHNEPSTEL